LNIHTHWGQDHWSHQLYVPSMNHRALAGPILDNEMECGQRVYWTSCDSLVGCVAVATVRHACGVCSWWASRLHHERVGTGGRALLGTAACPPAPLADRDCRCILYSIGISAASVRTQWGFTYILFGFGFGHHDPYHTLRVRNCVWGNTKQSNKLHQLDTECGKDCGNRGGLAW
jgi:hypothetical protein